MWKQFTQGESASRMASGFETVTLEARNGLEGKAFIFQNLTPPNY